MIRVSTRMKAEVYKMVVKTEEQIRNRAGGQRDEDVELLSGLMRMDRSRNENISGAGHLRCLGDKVREVRLSWFGCGRRRPPGGPKRRDAKLMWVREEAEEMV